MAIRKERPASRVMVKQGAYRTLTNQQRICVHSKTVQGKHSKQKQRTWTSRTVRCGPRRRNMSESQIYSSFKKRKARKQCQQAMALGRAYGGHCTRSRDIPATQTYCQSVIGATTYLDFF